MTIAYASVRTKNLFEAAMLFGIFSLVSASFFVVLDAVDVAMTEAAVGAGVSTILMLSTLAVTGHKVRPRPVQRNVLAIAVSVLLGAALVYGTLDMPRIGDPDAPVQTHPIARHFIEVSPVETQIPNMVTPLLASYRGYDTLGETAVVFTAGIGVLALIGRRRRRDGTPVEAGEGVDAMQDRHRVLRIVGKQLIPAILLYACYVQAHGDFGPGGGFQAGVIFASALMLFMLLVGIDEAEKVIKPKVLEKLIALGLLIYGCTGLLTVLKGGAFLDYKVLAHDPIHGLHYGILAVELGVGITVTAVITTIIFTFAGHMRGRQKLVAPATDGTVVTTDGGAL
ncbi:Na(+)/H(+) antiporter subunit A [Planctomycetes bacterium Poly30]|uniref:Na(+)/H(+) antiporter subunit A n=1 Tax=Saltatorellus ferox TaxID=2528018 RepID=A0A518EXL4_9BACT|nr:Na(+)/H(+) antiporter subunit A [Planctomycetes bacterium Poly30]